jgi:DNA-directed RNA polymerase specialized sigma24 family protein
MSRTRPEKSEDDVIAQLAPLRRYARALTRDETQAEDLVHDALVRAYEGRATFCAGANLRTWLLSILHNTFVDGRRQRETLVHGYANPLTIRRFVKLAESPKVLKMLPYGRIRATRSRAAASVRRQLPWFVLARTVTACRCD